LGATAARNVKKINEYIETRCHTSFDIVTVTTQWDRLSEDQGNSRHTILTNLLKDKLEKELLMLKYKHGDDPIGVIKTVIEHQVSKQKQK
jgi:hypothetical protein